MHNKPHSEETKQKISIANKGKVRTEKTKEKISESCKGRKFSEEHKRNLSVSKIGENNPNFGKKFSRETREKMSESRKGMVFSEEHRKNIIKARTGKKLSEEHIKNIKRSKTGKNNPNYGKKRSLETKRKIRKTTIKNYGFSFPHYNKKACEYFKKFDEENNTKGLYGSNEYLIEELGYWPDYINFDMKLIVEWDEEYHFIKGKLRQKEIQEYFSDFKFKRIREKNFIKE